MPTAPAYFRVCSTCRKEIGFEQRWYRCSVTTCNRGNTALFFCSVECWSAHVPVVRHRDAWAEEERSPSREAWQARLAQEQRDSEVSASSSTRQRAVGQEVGAQPAEVLVVVSKLKAYVRARSGFNTSDNVAEELSDHLRELCRGAIQIAEQDGRRTLMDRDFRAVLRRRGG